MKLFKCQHCGQVVYFENEFCERCKYRLGFIPETFEMSALEPAGTAWRALDANGRLFRLCANAEFEVCNWLVDDGAPDKFCIACQHNRTIPDISVPANLQAWRKIEFAKHRLFYSLLRLKLPLSDIAGKERLAFDFLAEAPPGAAGPKVLTGHENGLITLSIREADDAEREKRRTQMGEPYRTLLGHFRHEVGHFYWDRLVRDEGKTEAYREIFGDERADYEAALKAHYQNGAPPNWQEGFISAYATTHPWEDFAETWAHYLHIVDTLEMAGSLGMSVHPDLPGTEALDVTIDFDAYRVTDARQLIARWIPLSGAINNLNRAMGQADLYPFVLSPPVIAKLGFIHDLVHAHAK